jgi:hypothetical protein
MTTSYEIHFSGDLLPGVDPAVARARIQGLFKLTDEVAARLFSGQTVVLKRGLDLARAERLRQVFLEVGALARLVEQGPAAAPLAPPAPPPVPAEKAALPRDWTLGTSGWPASGAGPGPSATQGGHQRHESDPGPGMEPGGLRSGRCASDGAGYQSFANFGARGGPGRA